MKKDDETFGDWLKRQKCPAGCGAVGNFDTVEISDKIYVTCLSCHKLCWFEKKILTNGS
jgi:hypothetical protein